MNTNNKSHASMFHPLIKLLKNDKMAQPHWQSPCQCMTHVSIRQKHWFPVCFFTLPPHFSSKKFVCKKRNLYLCPVECQRFLRTRQQETGRLARCLDLNLDNSTDWGWWARNVHIMGILYPHVGNTISFGVGIAYYSVRQSRAKGGSKLWVPTPFCTLIY